MGIVYNVVMFLFDLEFIILIKVIDIYNWVIYEKILVKVDNIK